MRKLTRVIIHCSATPPNMHIGAKEIKEWHLQRGFNDIGYHFVIQRSGKVEEGRPIKKPGAHAKGHNADSIGICLVGGVDNKGHPEDNFLHDQIIRLKYLLQRWPDLEVLGHRDLPGVGKACPSFDVKEKLCN